MQIKMALETYMKAHNVQKCKMSRLQCQEAESKITCKSHSDIQFESESLKRSVVYIQTQTHCFCFAPISSAIRSLRLRKGRKISRQSSGS